ncbi:AMP-binding protein [Pseudomonas syringae]|uniref:AMP-binding protein n=1 Tax=Pseudomonas syringae TaxID=317 RepID=UPI0020C0C8DC|nr:AMP-binding protein [Pseudomonas syringae]MCL6309465.1 AMP-binding protein [Pseudomonas syringae]
MDRLLYELFTSTTHCHPNSKALESLTDSLTYAELLVKVDTLAEILEHNGVKRNDGRFQHCIGLISAQTVSTYSAYLAIIACNAIVVPISPTAPLKRTEVVVASAHISWVLGDGPRPESLPSDCAYWDLSTPFPAGLNLVGKYGAFPSDGCNLAYILFTSGTTGDPKGVPISSRNLRAFLDDGVSFLDLAEGQRFSQTFDLTFDLSLFGMLACWSTGATLILPAPWELASPVDYVRDRNLTHWFSVPSAIALARNTKNFAPDTMPSLCWSLFCGESLTFEDAIKWAKAATNSRVANLYGPTETTISCTRYILPEKVEDWPKTSNDTVPLGDAHPLSEIWILADNPLFPEGELCVRGAQRFNGYLDDAQNELRFLSLQKNLSQDKLTRLPKSDSWYRTGDRVRIEGELLVHIGRLDDQVKIQGFRVELSDVRAVLLRNRHVHNAAVVSRKATCGIGSIQIEAVVIANSLSLEELNIWLQDELPWYMVPEKIIFVSHLPLNSNGKINATAVLELISESDQYNIENI